MTSEARASVMGGAVMKYTYSFTPVAIGPSRLYTSVAFSWEIKNYNGMFQNRRIVMVFL